MVFILSLVVKIIYLKDKCHLIDDHSDKFTHTHKALSPRLAGHAVQLVAPDEAIAAIVRRHILGLIQNQGEREFSEIIGNRFFSR